jgi:hypothetical protein
MRRGVRFVLPSALLVALIAGHTALWFAATDHLSVGFDAWMARSRHEGWQVDAGPRQRGGWPLAATLTVPDLTLSGGAPHVAGRITWHADSVVLTLAAQAPSLLGVDIPGAQTLQIEPGPVRAFQAERMHLDVPFTPAPGAPVASLEIRNLRGDEVTIGLLTGQVTAGPAPSLDTSAEAIELPSTQEWAFGRRISSLAIDATLHGGLPPPGSVTASATAWRDNGGSIDVTHLALGWGPLGLSATGKFSLDDQLQPTGTADLHVVGYAKSLSVLAAQHVITADAALAATAVMTLLAHVPQDGGAPEVEVPLTLRGGKLLLGNTPLVRVRPLAWPR